MDDELVDITTQRRELIIPLPTGDQAVLTYPFPMDEETFEYLGQFFNMAKRGMTLSAKTSKDAARPPSNENDRRAMLGLGE